MFAFLAVIAAFGKGKAKILLAQNRTFTASTDARTKGKGQKGIF